MHSCTTYISGITMPEQRACRGRGLILTQAISYCTFFFIFIFTFTSAISLVQFPARTGPLYLSASLPRIQWPPLGPQASSARCRSRSAHRHLVAPILLQNPRQLVQILCPSVWTAKSLIHALHSLPSHWPSVSDRPRHPKFQAGPAALHLIHSLSTVALFLSAGPVHPLHLRLFACQYIALLPMQAFSLSHFSRCHQPGRLSLAFPRTFPFLPSADQ